MCIGFPSAFHPSLNDRQRERQRLSRACLRHADAVRAGQDLGHTVGLQSDP